MYDSKNESQYDTPYMVDVKKASPSTPSFINTTINFIVFLSKKDKKKFFFQSSNTPITRSKSGVLSGRPCE